MILFGKLRDQSAVAETDQAAKSPHGNAQRASTLAKLKNLLPVIVMPGHTEQAGERGRAVCAEHDSFR